MDTSSPRKSGSRARPAVLPVRQKQSSPEPPRWNLDQVVAQVAGLRAVAQAVEQLSVDRRLTLENVWPGSLPIAVAAFYRAAAAPTLVVTTSFSEAESFAGELEELLNLPVAVFPPGSEDEELESLTQQATAQRLHVISGLHKYQQHPDGPPPIVISTLPALMQHVPGPGTLDTDQLVLEAGSRIDLQELRRWLTDAGYHATHSVQLPGEYAMRGGIIDIFPPDEDAPSRIELFDDEIESLRTFDMVTQRSTGPRSRLQLVSARGAVAHDGLLLDFFPPDSRVWLHEPAQLQHAATSFLQRVPFPQRFAPCPAIWSRLATFPTVHAVQLADEGYVGQLVRFPVGSVERVGGELERLARDIDTHAGDRPVLVLALNDGEAERLEELLAPARARAENRLQILVSQLGAGFEIPPDGPLVLTATQLLRRTHLRRTSKRAKSRPIDSFLDLRPGDLVVHLSHGIAVYRGTELIDKHGQLAEHLVLEFAEQTKLYVPTTKIDLVQRYVGGTKSRPKLAKIGGITWQRRKKAAERAVQDMAAELLELQARRQSRPGIAFAPDSAWQNQFDASFSYVETPDQLAAIEAVKEDMLRPRPMDRLICGDVGFGKTEVAMRAAFKAVDSGYQVAVLVPTTVLAEQHYKTFRERMAEFPVEIAKLSRFCSPAEQRDTLAQLAAGRVDIVIGTHRLASRDVRFYNLGLLIIDEEQRFGVEIKERLKHLRENVDVLTLSATPIPRTLHMSLVGVRDISNLETAPEDRLSVETRTIRFDDKLIRNAILRELNRDGQVYFVHNRIQDIEEIAGRLRQIVPEARIVIGHGQMGEGELERVMVDFIDHRYDILLATTIIESGLDIPNANTIFINEAYRYGLSELHQLRGRVGRYKHQAYCYLVIDRHRHLSPDAARRLHAIEEYSQIGAGFGIAMRDLEIRGAGNLLGTQQSGHIAAVGYELYCQMLANAVRELKNEPPKLSLDVEIDLPVEALLPPDYVPDLRDRIDLYRRLSRADSVQALDGLGHELRDRFGPLPDAAKRLLQIGELRIDAALWFLKSMRVEDNYLVLAYTNRQRIEHLARLHEGRMRIVDQSHAYWPATAKGSVDWIAEAKRALRAV
ncbi:MAG: transcription-repair-coupling factor [Pirellulaceae bacterium]|nr:MAG: transcription-repair-coupling factor [Pirellulaceae bacterium]